jgi:hypothetical protein
VRLYTAAQSSVDREGINSAKAFFAVFNPKLIMESVFEIRVKYTVQQDANDLCMCPFQTIFR